MLNNCLAALLKHALQHRVQCAVPVACSDRVRGPLMIPHGLQELSATRRFINQIEEHSRADGVSA